MFELFCNLCTNGINFVGEARYLFKHCANVCPILSFICSRAGGFFLDNSLCLVRMFQFNCWFIHVIISNYAKIRFQKSLNWFFAPASSSENDSLLYQSSVKFNYVEIKLRHTASDDFITLKRFLRFQRLPVSSEKKHLQSTG